ncbi:hypothetical protein DDZ13_04915 [Coraliomargarita sinensis]|uniref:General secretion pathway protein GspM n=1 Tax=Coraliomargarita sinensis TaxID=2174842 RepID=A0A317ZGG1_9BACT|nr:hypothetical protein [Coraliomargarita sinensis]PXA04520.1 hypothetical protein DDZ13_04915 [Coraliomargarita sinensis]
MSAAKKRLKTLYKRTSLREKLLTLAFILVVLFLWGNNWLSRLSEWNDNRKFTASELEFQQKTLERGPEFDEGLKRALARVDPSKTYAATQLSGRIDSLLRNAGLSGQADIDSVRTREGEIFNDHNLRVQLDRISIDQLINFNALLKEDTPYINIQSVRISANRRSPEELDVRFEINSFDLKEPSL